MHLSKPILLAVSTTCFCSIGYSATQGSLGASSQGSVQLTAGVTKPAEVAALISISGLEDFDWSAVTDSNGNFSLPAITLPSVCVFMDSPGTYSINFTSGNLIDPFVLADYSDPNAPSVPYGILFSDIVGNQVSSVGSGLVPASVESCLTNAELSSLTISPSGGNFGFDITEEATAFMFDTLTITVTPD